MASPAQVESLKGQIKQLQAAVDSKKFEDAVTVLKVLKKVVATEELLRSTKAGLVVSKIRNCDNTAVSQLSKDVISKWKAEVDAIKRKKQAAASSAEATPPAAPTPKAEETKPAPPKVNTAVTKEEVTPSPTTERRGSTDGWKWSGDARSVKSDAVKIPTTGDKTRDKCVEMAYDAMVFDSGAPSELIIQRSQAIEKHCYQEAGSTNNDYRSKMRRLILNLKDKNNPSLRQAIVSGDLAIQRFCGMSNQEMASEERKQANDLLHQKNLHNSLAAAEQEAETDAFQCGRCKQRKTRYRQAQTRSADEPMTTFVTCTNCGNRWKFC